MIIIKNAKFAVPAQKSDVQPNKHLPGKVQQVGIRSFQIVERSHLEEGAGKPPDK